ncbi:AGE family epimerase/isomerase [Pseudoflavonifractor phocaeensis]|uniref:AGE family epimerase/isomerase n=1 Tax=Pseudoflavonifractor phocaeensis TaxID=1870988 RepID=UPI001F438761|nr:AGE family epimerase/isomerase [Pseudoflavonifractor phocaeensis]MCF2662587.1 AGE family epimerase/isomerase [Pseudoflavonifractor phocaeensis]
MDKNRLQSYRSWIQGELDACVRFWLDHGMDKEHGGVYTCLDRKGEIYSTDKSVWMQGRCGWMFAHLCRVYGVKEEWLAASKSCLDFLEDHCINHAAGGRMYFTVTEDGKPLRQRRYYFSEAFYALANAEYYGVTGEKEHLERARRAYNLYWDLAHGMPDPVGMGPKTIPETRTGRAFGIPMIILNVIGTLLQVDPEHKAEYEERAQACVDEIFQYHVHPELKCVLENVAEDGSARLYYTEGRTVNPGHDIEGVWFLLEHAKRTGNQELVQQAAQIFDWAIEAGWDKEYGGLLYFIDCLGKPPEAYEHDMKLWWPHNEILIASLMLYRDTNEEKYLDWFDKTLNYCREHFSDPENGEWYGYLRRDGLPTMPSTKGSTFKGPFHLPRCLIQCDTMLGELLER